MLFHTAPFLLFFTIICLALSYAGNLSAKKMILLLASYIFYMCWHPAFILLIITSTLIDYSAARQMDRSDDPRTRKMWLVSSLVCNLGFLGLFKYFYFFMDNLNFVRGVMGVPPLPAPFDILLPVGISFYTFQSMSYTIDVYRKKIPVCKSFLDVALYVSFFPQLVAGPIVRAVDFLPQLKSDFRLHFHEAAFFLFMRGLAKKVLVADNLAPFVDGVFADPSLWPSVIIWIATIAFYIQIYCDFSGYTDMALAVAAVLGFTLPKNFNRPMFAQTPSEFWQRWHISLSQWLRDYLYIPLGGNRGGSWLTLRNLMLTMLLGGLWHGANWNFILWGGMHGAVLVVHRCLHQWTEHWGWLNRIRPTSGYAVFRWVTFQYFMLLTWITFRIEDTDAMLIALQKFIFIDGSLAISGLGHGKMSFFSSLFLMLLFFTVHAVSFFTKGIDEAAPSWKKPLQYTFCFVAGILFFYFWPTSQQPYIYFQF